MRVCPFNGCEKAIDPTLFACRNHWFALSLMERSAIWKCWNGYRAGTIAPDKLREEQDKVLTAYYARVNRPC